MGVYAFSDLHGNYSLWTKLRQEINENDTYFYLGDVIDRGKLGFKILLEMMEMKNIIFLRGNHEEMFLKSLEDNFKKGTSENLSITDVWFSNGGVASAEEFCSLTSAEQDKIIDFLDKTPLSTCYYSSKLQSYIVLSHSGADFIWYENFNKSYQAFLKRDVLWNRQHIESRAWFGGDNVYLVHGHTPVDEPTKYCGNHKINIDIGAIFNNRLAILDLNTLQAKIIKG